MSENFISTEIEWVALNNADVRKDRQDIVIEFLETLEEDDDGGLSYELMLRLGERLGDVKSERWAQGF